MDEERLVEQINSSDVRGLRLRRRPEVGRLDSVKRVLHAKGMSMKPGKIFVHDRVEWRAIVKALMALTGVLLHLV